MPTTFDILGITLLAATAGLLLLRLRHERPPSGPYALAAIVGIVGNMLGNLGGGVAAVGLLMAGAFLILHLASEPYREDDNDFVQD